MHGQQNIKKFRYVCLSQALASLRLKILMTSRSKKESRYTLHYACMQDN